MLESTPKPTDVAFYFDAGKLALAIQTAKGDCVTSTVPVFGSPTQPERWVYAVAPPDVECSAQFAMSIPEGLEARAW